VIGRFVTLEGGEGVGKSTQLPRLADAIRATGREVVTTREPGGTPGAEAIREILMTGELDRWGARSEALLFAAARADHVDRFILPAVRRGAWVLCDRFIDSSRAYQGEAGGLGDADILALHTIGTGGFMPDRTVIFQLPATESSLRIKTRDGDQKDRMGSHDRSYYDRVTAAFERFADNDPERFRLINASGSEDVVTGRIMDAVRDLL
jgi:dTMP kinase